METYRLKINNFIRFLDVQKIFSTFQTDVCSIVLQFGRLIVWLAISSLETPSRGNALYVGLNGLAKELDYLEWRCFRYGMVVV